MYESTNGNGCMMGELFNPNKHGEVDISINRMFCDYETGYNMP